MLFIAISAFHEGTEQLFTRIWICMAGRHDHDLTPLVEICVLDKHPYIASGKGINRGQILLKRSVNEVYPTCNRLTYQSAALQKTLVNGLCGYGDLAHIRKLYFYSVNHLHLLCIRPAVSYEPI